MKRMVFGSLALAGLVLVESPAISHHSFVAYDLSKTLTVTGTIKQFRWGAPHSSMVLVYRDRSGKQAQMSVVGGSPLMFSRQGFAPRDFRRGYRVTVTYHPNASGVPGGTMASIRLPDGRAFRDAEVLQSLGRIAPPAK
jgi:Family of unknown function (DUF6152)